MAAPKGNKHRQQLKTPDIRKEAYKQYCEHIASGKPHDSWYFQHPKLTCTYKTIEKYIRENPLEFPPIQKEIAVCQSYGIWFEEGRRMAFGHFEKCQPAVYQMIMRNKFGWDKDERVVAEIRSAADEILDRINALKEQEFIK